MSLYRKWENTAGGMAAIWQIEEPLSFFETETGLSSDIRNERRRTEHLAGRFLLRFLQPGFPIHSIAKDDQDKPRIPGDVWHFSISHSWPWVAVVLSREAPVGIDIQTWHPRIADIQHKFLSAEEQQMIGPSETRITLAWCAKECVYKWNGKRGVEFIEELPISAMPEVAEPNMTIIMQSFEAARYITIKSIVHTDFACCFVENVSIGPTLYY
jgi:phosphopantetheinyl transferase